MRKIASVALVALPLLSPACAVDQTTDAESQTADASAVRRVLLCQQGLSDRTLGWDKGLFDLCERVEDAGFTLVRDGDYPAFGALDGSGAYQALFETLDTNGDGQVDDDDQRSLVHLVGFSWGGISIARTAAALLDDDRIASKRAGVGALVLFDPYQPLASLQIPGNVLYAWVYRESETTSGDCSMTPSFGLGFNGKIPSAARDHTFCTHYDLDAIVGPTGHCQVPPRASEAAFVNLTTYQDYEPWSDGAVTCEVDD